MRVARVSTLALVAGLLMSACAPLASSPRPAPKSPARSTTGVRGTAPQSPAAASAATARSAAPALVATAHSTAPALAAPARAVAPTPSASGTTAGALAAEGAGVFATNCAKCHGPKGEGITAPALIGPDANLVSYATGRGLYDFVSANMPQDNPGALSSTQYLDVVSYLLVARGDVDPSQSLSSETLDSAKLRR